MNQQIETLKALATAQRYSTLRAGQDVVVRATDVANALGTVSTDAARKRLQRLGVRGLVIAKRAPGKSYVWRLSAKGRKLVERS